MPTMRARRARLAALVAVGALLLATWGATTTSAAQASQSKWETGRGGWSGKGRVFLPGGVHGGPSEASPCPECVWLFAPVCELEGEQNCHDTLGCQPGRYYAIIIMILPNGDREWVTSGCMNDDPVTEEEVGRFVRDKVQQSVPLARPRFQPGGQSITNLPTNFRAGQRGRLARSDGLGGLTVSFEAQARWRWDFGDGTAPLVTTSPGGHWPTMTVTHTYHRPGRYKAGLRSIWTAQYYVDGNGPFDVAGGPLVRDAAFTVPVKEARSVLVGTSIR